MEPLFPGSYAVGPRFLAGRHPERSEVEALVAAGTTYFLDLTETGEREPYVPDLPQGVTGRRMPIPDFSIPDVRGMRQILDELDAALQAGHRVYLHCFGGLGRTGTVVGCYLVRHGLAGDAALARIRQLRTEAGCSPESPETEAQRAMVRTWQEA